MILQHHLFLLIIIGSVIYMLLDIPANASEPSYTLVKEQSKDSSVNLVYPKLMGLSNKVIQDKLNNAITSEAKDWKCDEETEPGKAQFSVSTKVMALTKKIFSYKLDFNYYCGGPYSDSHSESRNYNLETGKQFNLADFLQPNIDNKAISDLFLKGSVTDKECKSSYDENTSYNFYITSNNLIVFPELPHIVEACAVELIVPLEKIRPERFADLNIRHR